MIFCFLLLAVAIPLQLNVSFPSSPCAIAGHCGGLDQQGKSLSSVTFNHHGTTSAIPQIVPRALPHPPTVLLPCFASPPSRCTCVSTRSPPQYLTLYSHKCSET